VLGNFAFTLYEVFGYLLPGGIAFLAFFILYWTSFAPSQSLSIANFQLGSIAWIVIVIACYVFGHAMQAVGNVWFGSVENSLLDPEKGTAPAWLRERARQAAIAIADGRSEQHFEPRWLFRILDEYALQNGKPGDREMFVYREGFYRGISRSLFLLAFALLVRMVVPGTSVFLRNGLSHISFWELLATSIVFGVIAYLCGVRYRRFAEYRVTRAVLSALIVQGRQGSNPDAM
jgi:hypothetical protein